jgi:two-component system chemotaxis response regulator CheB
MNLTKKIRVLVVDDSAVVRKMVCSALADEPCIEVVGTAPDPYVAREKILELDPDVLTLDIEMPRMDGITFLKILQQHRPMPVIVISSLTQAGSAAALAALEAGAVDVLAKPTSAFSIGNLGEQLAMRIKAAAASRRIQMPVATTATATPRPLARPGGYHPRQLIVIGASTGGTEALREVLTHLPAGFPPIAIVQHIPPYFSRALAERLNGLCDFEVREAQDGDELRSGTALIAPGDFHMTVHRAGQGFRVAVNQNPPVHHCRPAVDVLFRSASECNNARIIAGILTGMGSDGAMGMQLLKKTGAQTFAQDEATSVVYGMPRAAAELGAVDHILPLDKIAPALIEAAGAMAGEAIRENQRSKLEIQR